MVGPRRPQFVLFGSSIVQYSFDRSGWGAMLADIYSRKADIILRGYSGWNSRRALQVIHQVFPKDDIIQPSLVIVYFGGNDSTGPHPSGVGPHVPLPEYIDNMRKIANHLKSLSDTIRIIFLSSPSMNEEKVRELSSGPSYRTNELCRVYAEACVELCKEMNIEAINLWTALQKRKDWLDVCFTDGIHLSAEGSKMVSEEILKVVKEAKWEPSLYWKSMFVSLMGFIYQQKGAKWCRRRYLRWSRKPNGNPACTGSPCPPSSSRIPYIMWFLPTGKRCSLE